MAWPLSHLLGTLVRRSRSASRRGSRRGPGHVPLEAEPLEARWVPSLTTLISFNGANGANPDGGVLLDTSGNFWGTTSNGGTAGDGTVFELDPGTGNLINTLNLSASGAHPLAGLIADSSGRFFGTASSGGTNGDGTVFEVEQIGVLGYVGIDLGNFNGSNGVAPAGGLLEDSSGNFFGTARGGPPGDGVVFTLPAHSNTITDLGLFTGGEGADPVGGLLEDTSGDLFGTATSGGGFGGGAVFKLTAGSTTITDLASFNGTNGSGPECTLLEDSSGNLFGTTTSGGPAGDGTVFELAKPGALTTLASFNGANGSAPQCTLLEDSSGNLFGTTSSGGPAGDGTLFEVAKGTGAITTLAFFDGAHGANPVAGLLEDSSGDFFGTTSMGGTSNDGTVFEFQFPKITTLALASWTVNHPGYSQTINDSKTTGTVTFSATGSLPLGLTLSTSGVLSGTPTTVGTYTFTVTATDAVGSAASQSYTVVINPTVTLTTSPTLTSWTPHQPGYSQTIHATGGTGSFTFALTSGSLPPGLTLGTGGVLTGTPTTAGTYVFTVTATDKVGASGSQPYVLTISPGPLATYQVAMLPFSPTVEAGSDFLVTVQAFDQYGNAITNYSGPSTVTAVINPTSSASSFPASVSIGTNGQGQIVARLQTVGTYKLTASSGSVTSNALTLTVTAGAAAKLAFATQPASRPTGVALPTVTVQVLDGFGNVVATDNTDAVTVTVTSGLGGFTTGSTTTATVHNGVASFSNLTLVVPGTYTLGELVPFRYTGPNSASFSVLPLQVVPGSFAGTPSGFSLQFNTAFLVNSLTPVLYGQGFGATAPVPSVLLNQTKDAGGNPVNVPVVGSLVLNTATNSINFVATNTVLQVNNGSPLLPDGTYTAIVHSSALTDGFQAQGLGGGFLDGLGTGTPGSGDFTASFTVATAGYDVVWVPAVAEGPGQGMNAPGMNQAGGGYPVYLNSSGGVTNVLVTLNYEPGLLTVTGVSGAGFMMLGASAPGQAVLQYSGPALPAGMQKPIGFLTASVPAGTTANPIPYKAKDLLHLTNLSINGGTFPAVGDDALHLLAYVGDADGSGAYSSNDAVLITRALLSTDTGFAAYPLVDPVIVADTDGAGFIPADAALQVNEAGVGFPTANLPIPPIPSGVHFQARVYKEAAAPALADKPAPPAGSRAVDVLFHRSLPDSSQALESDAAALASAGLWDLALGESNTNSGKTNKWLL